MLCFFAPALFAGSAQAVDDVAGDLITFNDNGAWVWFTDERAIVDTATNQIIVTSVADQSGTGGLSRNGDIEIASYNLGTEAVIRHTLANGLEANDHAQPAIYQRTDGRYAVAYSRHNDTSGSRFVVSTNPGDITSWGSVSFVNSGSPATYLNMYYLPADNNGAGRLYNFVRSENFDPNVHVSNDEGTTWSYGGKLVTEGGSSQRPYARYTSDGEKIHVTVTEHHPRNLQNSVYHGYVQDGALYNSAGSVVDANVLDGIGVSTTNLTQVFANGTSFGGTTMNRAWTVDNAVASNGAPVTVFQVRANDSDTDHRFIYGRWDGSSWQLNELAKAGGFLYNEENDYTGLVAIDPNDVNTVFISTKIDPRDDSTTGFYEIYQGQTTDDGASWDWSAITENSTMDNIRPIVPEWDEDNTALLWLRGDYTTFVDYDLDVVGIVVPEPTSLGLLGLGGLIFASRRLR
ncbi:MAG: BNR repeat-containing protein [Phycisphaeraceae bacterium]|nr:BNR repeat-containing protein [Phycisphaeraceae bacterium]